MSLCWRFAGPGQARMRVFINCDVQLGGGTGGVEQLVAGLLWGLGQLDSGHEFLLGVRSDAVEWLEPFIGGGMRPVPYDAGPPPPAQPAIERRVRAALRPVKRRVEAVLGREPPRTFIDALEPDVVHLPWQEWVETSRPVILNLHDLQHLHFPQFFSGEELERRARWIEWARRAAVLPASSEWTAQDFVEKLGVPPEKVPVLEGASPLDMVPDPPDELIAEVRTRFELPAVFGLYPATTWEHKNHSALAEALAAQGDPELSIICTGFRTEGWGRVEETVERLGLRRRFRLLGFVTPQELKALYRLCTFVIVPSLFEGGGSAAMYEALGEGVPLACSDIPSIPQGVREAALLFDPASTDSIADAIRRMLHDPGLLGRLRESSREHGKRYTIPQAAKRYLDLYEELAARTRSKAPLRD